jgi:RNase P protein component
MQPNLMLGFDIVILPKPQSGQLKRQDIDRALGELFQRAGIVG